MIIMRRGLWGLWVWLIPVCYGNGLNYRRDKVERMRLNPSVCKISPSTGAAWSNYYLLECPSEVGTVTIDFVSGKIKKSGRQISQLSIKLPRSGEIVTEYLASCENSVCKNMQLDAKRYPSDMPQLTKLICSHSAVSSDRDLRAMDYSLRVYENVPLNLLVDSDLGFSDTSPLVGQRGFTDQAVSTMKRPRLDSDFVKFYITDRDHHKQNNITVNLETVRSSNPDIFQLKASTGRLDPEFSPSRYVYYLRVPESTQSVKLKFSAMDDRNTLCSVTSKIASGSLTNVTSQILGTGVTDWISTLPNSNVLDIDFVGARQTIHLDCVNDGKESRYTLIVIHQLGGSTNLKMLGVIGGDLEEPFDPNNPAYAGPYHAKLNVKYPWVGFITIPENDRVNVTVNGYPIDRDTSTSPMFRLSDDDDQDYGSDGYKNFYISLRTELNPVAQVYHVRVKRVQPVNKLSSGFLSNILGYTSTFISSVRAYTFLHNAHFLQWISVTQRIPDVDPLHSQWTRYFHKWNLIPRSNFAPSSSPLDSANSNIVSWHDASVFLHGGDPKLESAMNRNILNAALKKRQTANFGTSIKSEVDFDVLELFPSAFKFGDSIRKLDASNFYLDGSNGDLDGSNVDLDGSNGDLNTIMQNLEDNYKKESNVLAYMRGFVFVTTSLGVIAILYALVWSMLLNKGGSIRQDCPRILYPVRFGLFVLDFALIGYAQCCIGLLLSPTASKERIVVHFLGLALHPNHFTYASGVMLLLFPLSFFSGTAFILLLNQHRIVFTKLFQRHADPRFLSVKAFWQPLAKIPIIGRIFDIEISKFLTEPLKDKNGNDLQPFYPESRSSDVPWLQATINSGSTSEEQEPLLLTSGVSTAANSPNLFGSPSNAKMKLNSPQPVKYYKDFDGIQVVPSDYLGMNHNYDVVTKYPEAFVGYNKQGVANLYGEKLQVYGEVRIKHWANIFAVTEPTIIIPRENLEFLYADALSNIVAKAGIGNFHQWVMERFQTLTLVFLLALGSSKALQVLCCLIAVNFLYSMVSVFNGSSTAWYNQFDADVTMLDKLQTKYRAEKIQGLELLWPYRDENARKHYRRVRDIKQQQKNGQVFYMYYSMLVLRSLQSLWYNPFWKTRLAMAMNLFLTGQPMTEISKLAVALILLFNSRERSSSSVGNVTVGYSTFTLAAVALVLLNWEAMKIFADQIKDFSYELYISGVRRGMIGFVDYVIQDPVNGLINRFAFYINQCSMAFTAGSNHIISFIYGGFQAETIREIICQEMSIVSNDVGINVRGGIFTSSKIHRKLNDINDPVSVIRFTNLQKTLHIGGGIGVYRSDLDRSMPVVLSINDFCGKTTENRLAATIQIVNHNTFRYIPTIPHTEQDDSFLSLFTDPRFVPPPGQKLVSKGTLPNHGYVIKLDKIDQVLRIRGPNILPGKTYHIKLTKNPPPRDANYPYEELDTTDEVTTTAHMTTSSSLNCSANVICMDPGKLVVPVPKEMTPDLQDDILISPPGSNVTFTHDPVKFKSLFDRNTNTLIIKSQHALLAGNQEYKVTWKVKRSGSLLRATTTQPIAVRGEIILSTRGENGTELHDLDSSAWCVIRDTEQSTTIDINPSLTNAHEFIFNPTEGVVLSSLEGSSGWLTQKIGRITAEIDTVVGIRSLRDMELSEAIPCTVVQCVDPIAKKWRVEPDFDEAVFKVAARMQELTAMSIQLKKQPDSVSDLWFRIISPTEYINFWKSQGILIVDHLGRFVDPLRSPNQRQSSDQIQDLLQEKLGRQMRDLNKVQNWYQLWAAAYRNLELYEAQANLDSIQQDPEASLLDIAHCVNTVRGLKSQYEQVLPNFQYPMILQEKLISKASNWEMQFLQWEKLISVWLLQEEGASDEEKVGAHLSGYEHSLYQIMNSLKTISRKPENLLRGQTKSVLHYVLSSHLVRGIENVAWRPDPLGASLALMRVWGLGKNNKPTSDDCQWEICFLKLTATGIKIMMPSREDHYDDAVPWNNVCGWQIPLLCFEEILCLSDSGSIPEDHTRYDFDRTMTGKMVFRRNTLGTVHDNYVKRISDGMLDNNFIKSNNQSARKIMLGFTTQENRSDLPWYETQVAGNQTYTHPLTFRLWPGDLNRWQSVVNACNMDRPCRLHKEFTGIVPGEEVAKPPVLDLISPPVFDQYNFDEEESTETLSVKQPSSETVELEANEVALPIVEYKLNPQDWRYMGKIHNMKASEPTILTYAGDVYEAQKNGAGKAAFLDKKGMLWGYEGGFYCDEPAGEGSLTLVDQDEINRLKESTSIYDKSAIVSFKGTVVPRAKSMRNDAVPSSEKPGFALPMIRKLLEEEVAKSYGETPPKDLIVDKRRSMSACGHENLLGVTMNTLNAMFNQDRAPQRPSEALAYETSLKDGKVGNSEFLPFEGAWAKQLDPNLGMHKVCDSIGAGDIAFADGCRLLKHDHTPMLNGKLSGKGHFYCPICPMNYWGDFKNGKPDGQGIMEIYSGKDKVVYWGSFREGKRHGRGGMALKEEKVYMEGYFEDDLISGGLVVIDIHKDLADQYNNIQWFEGEFKNGLPNGHGAMSFFKRSGKTVAPGVTYRGDFKDGIRHGLGCIQNSQGNLVLKCHWDNDQANGKADAYHLASGMLYVGHLKGDERCGPGKLFESVAGGLIYDGTWDKDQPHGRGTLYAPDGQYEGEFEYGKRHGKGTFTFIEGPSENQRRIYAGSWKDDQPHGFGTYLADDDVVYTVE